MKRHNNCQQDDVENAQQNSADRSVGTMLKLQHRKELLERRLEEKCTELKRLCLEEFELTGTLPRETPFEVGESPPKIRRKVLTMFPYDKEFLKELSQQTSSEENLKRKALSPWNSCDHLPSKTSSASPLSPKHNTWTSPQGASQSTARVQPRSQLPKTLKFFKKFQH